MNINHHRRSSGLTCLAAAGIVFTIGLGAAIVTTDYSPGVVASNADQYLFAGFMDLATRAGIDAAMCRSWQTDPATARTIWAADGVNPEGINVLSELFNEECDLSV